MARIRTVTDAGNSLNAQALGMDIRNQVTRVELGSGHVTTSALARARTGVVTPFAPVKESLSPPVLAEAGNPVAQVIYFEQPDGNTYDYNEIAVFAGSTCIYYECDDAGAVIGSKDETIALVIHIAFVFSNGDPALVARQFVFAPLATQNNVGMVQYATDPLTTDLFQVLNPAQVRALVAALPRGLTRDEALAVLDGRIRSYQYSEIVFADATGTGARARIDVVNGSGGITGVQVLAGGDGYSAGATATVRRAIGTGAVLAVTVVGGRVTAVNPTTAGSGYGVSLPSAAPADGTIELLYEAWDGAALGF